MKEPPESVRRHFTLSTRGGFVRTVVAMGTQMCGVMELVTIPVYDAAKCVVCGQGGTRSSLTAAQ